MLGAASQIPWQEDDILNLEGCGLINDGVPLQDWQTQIAPGFGSYAKDFGVLEGDWLVEVDDSDDLGDGTVRTPMLEFGLADYNYLQQTGQPIPGMQAIGDNGDLYQYTAEYDPTDDGSLGGRLRRFFKRVKKRVRKVAKKIKKIAKAPHKLQKKLRKKLRGKIKKVMAKTKFGRALIKIGGKVHNVYMKKVRPFIKKAGPWMKRLAPLAMAIPGVGPIISKGMVIAGNVAHAMKIADAARQVVNVVDKSNGSIVKMVKHVSKNPRLLNSALQAGASAIGKLPRFQQLNLAKKFDHFAKTKKGFLDKVAPIRRATRASNEAAKRLSVIAQKENAVSFARNKMNPIAQRRRALSHARQLQGRQLMARANTQLALQRNRPTGKTANMIKAMKIAALKSQLRGLGVRV